MNSVCIYTPASGYNYTYSSASILFCRSWHGYHFGDPLGCGWFSGELYHNSQDTTVPFPTYIYTSAFNVDSLKDIKKNIMLLNNDSDRNRLSANDRISLNQKIIKQFDRYTLSIKKENPILYYIKTPLYCLTNFFQISAYSIFHLNNLSTHLYSYLYWFILLTGLIGILFFIRYCLKLTPHSVIPLIVVYIILIHGPILCMPDNRYFIPAYPFLLICTSVLFEKLLATKLRTIKHQIIGH
jgi:hypothetical protein